MMEGRILSTQNTRDREPSAALQIYDELKNSYTNLVEQVSPTAGDVDKEYHEVTKRYTLKYVLWSFESKLDDLTDI